jgi:hypothetical protein
MRQSSGKNDPTAAREPAEPMPPMDRTEPTDPTDRSELREQREPLSGIHPFRRNSDERERR